MAFLSSEIVCRRRLIPFPKSKPTPTDSPTVDIAKSSNSSSAFDNDPSADPDSWVLGTALEMQAQEEEPEKGNVQLDNWRLDSIGIFCRPLDEESVDRFEGVENEEFVAKGFEVDDVACVSRLRSGSKVLEMLYRIALTTRRSEASDDPWACRVDSRSAVDPAVQEGACDEHSEYCTRQERLRMRSRAGGW